MKRINIGMIDFMASKKMHEAYSKTDSQLNEVNDFALKFLEVINESSLLQQEFKIFNNLKNKYIENELAATRYIDNNIKLMEVYTLKEIDTEHEKLRSFINEDIEFTDSKIDLFIAINNLITESLKDNLDVDVDAIHESYTIVLNHIKNNKPKEQKIIVESSEISEEIIEMAIDKFNTKYDLMEQEDKALLVKLIKSDDEEKKAMLEEIKGENLKMLEGVEKENISEKVEKTVNKLNEMKYNEATIIDDILSLHELKKALI